MISSVSSGPSFSGVVPIRVFIDGKETYDPKLIKASCRQLSTMLSSGSKKGEQTATLVNNGTTKTKEDLIRSRFAAFDKDYKNSTAKLPFGKPSDFFRCVISRDRGYLVTGPQTTLIESYGKLVGSEKIACRERGVDDSLDLMIAKRNYGRIIDDVISSAKLRLKEGLDKLITLNIEMKSNGKYGLTTFKTKLDNITFTT